MVEVDAALVPAVRRFDPPWHPTYATKTAELVEHWSRKLSVTPPLLAPHEGGCCFAGGNHRFYVAKEKQEREILVLFNANDAEVLRRMVPSLADG